MTLGDLFRPLVRYWWLVVVMTAIATVAAYAASDAQRPVFEARTTLVVHPNTDLARTEALDSLVPLDRSRIVPTFADITASKSVVETAARQVGISTGDLDRYETATKILPESLAVELTTHGPDRSSVSRVSDEVVREATDRFTSAYRVYSIDVLSPREVAHHPIFPRPLRDAGLTFALAAILAWVVAIALDQRRLRAAATASAWPMRQDELQPQVAPQWSSTEAAPTAERR